MSKDTIYRQDAINALHTEIVKRRISEDVNDDGSLDEFDTEDILRKLPSAQPELIRCKDCRWFGDEGCAILIVDDSDKPKEDDFCSRAERRTDDCKDNV